MAEMRRAGHTVGGKLYTSLLCGLAKERRWDLVAQVFDSMGTRKVPVDGFTCAVLIAAAIKGTLPKAQTKTGWCQY
eukprot:1190668-Prorocentrum_minimum.AAC.3